MSENWNELSVETLETSTEREGLPRTYRMRADSHYVDQLASSSAGYPVRMIPISQIDGQAIGSENDLRPLIESVRMHGIVQPLMVRRTDTRYTIIAGRKRLASAHMLQFPAVPCVIREVNEIDASALQAADNLRIQSPARVAPADSAGFDGILAEHVLAIRKCADMVSTPGALSAAALDLLKAHTWRAERFVGALSLVRNEPFPVEHDRALAAILDSVVEGFLPECRLLAVTLRGEVREPLSSSGLNGAQLSAGIAGAIMATLPLVQRAARPTIVVRMFNDEGSAVVCEVSQTDAPVSAGVAANFFNDLQTLERHADRASSIGALAAKALAEQHNGSAKFEPLEIGSKLSLVMMRRS